MQDAGAPVSKTAEIECYTEVVFKKRANKNKKSRPDGLIVIKSRNKFWTALVESKVGSSDLEKNQIEEYLEIAKLNNINALITISNQFVTVPTHNPVDISKNKLKSTNLIHYSWLSLEAKANLLLTSKVVDDPEQAIILKELIQFMKDPVSGVTSFSQMEKGWREITQEFNKGITPKKSDPNIEDAISSWQQFSKYLCLRLSDYVQQPVNEYISRKREKDPHKNYEANLNDIIKNNYLDAEFDIPNAAARLHISADFKTRTIYLKMSLDAPQDRTLPKSCITWITRQIKHLENDPKIYIRANWPRGVYEMKHIATAIEDSNNLIPEGVNDLPRTLDVIEVIDLAGKFSATKKFVELTTDAVLKFYSKVGENLRQWVPEPPKSKKSDKKVKAQEKVKEQNVNPFWIPPNN